MVANLLVVAFAATPAQDSAVEAAFAGTRHELRIDEGRLGGSGGELLLNRARAARFTLVGEEHGVREVPILVTALLRNLKPAGYSVLAIEVSPLAARRLAETAATPNPRATLATLFRDTRNRVPFYTMAPETDLLAWAISRDGGGLALWGLDYEIFADRYWLGRLESMAGVQARPAVRAARAVAESGFARAERGDPSQVFSFNAPESLFVAVRRAVRPRAGTDAALILDVLETTVAINRPFLAGKNYESNRLRSDNLKRNFLRAWTDPRVSRQPPKVLFKFGAYHMDRGLNGVRQYDVGWLAAAMAESRGERSFHLLVVGGPGTQHSVFDIRKLAYAPRPVEWIAAPWLAAARSSLKTDGFAVFDLEPLRALVQDKKLRNLPDELVRMIFGFDVLVVLTGSGPA